MPDIIQAKTNTNHPPGHGTRKGTVEAGEGQKMTTRKRALGVALCLAVAAAVLLGPAGQRAAGKVKVETTFATAKITQEYVSRSHLLQVLKTESFKIKVRQLDEAAVYRGLMSGKIDLGSVLMLPGDVGVKDFKKAFKQPPKVLTLGHLAVTVIAPKKTGIRRLSVAQLGGVISGKTTTWEQLGGTGGKIKLLVDQNAADLICILTGKKCVAGLRLLRHSIPHIAASVMEGALTKGGDLCLGISSARHFMSAGLKTEGVVTLPISTGPDAKAVAPTLVTVRNGSYPLGRPWRLVLRPGAPAIAKRGLDILANPRGGRGELDPLMGLWLIEPAVSPVPNHVRIGIRGWYCELKAAAKVYKRKNPQVTFTFLTNKPGGIVQRFQRGQMDLLAFTGELSNFLSKDGAKQFKEAFAAPPRERTIAYWPYAVVVHPKNPVESMTIEQLRTLVTSREARWRDLGRDQDGRIRLNIYGTYLIGQAISGYDFATGQNNGPRAITHEEQMQYDRACSKHRVRLKGMDRYMSLEDRFLEAMAEDVDGIALWYHSKKVAASGLKVLPIVSGKARRAARPTDLPAVASGRYVLRTPLKVLVHPRANKATRDFVEWLLSPQAGDLMRADKVTELTGYKDLPTVAHASLAAKDAAPAKGPTTAPTTAGADTFDGRVDGAVAVLPTEPLSMYFLMADRSHHVAYERAITEALVSDARLKIVDRTQLVRVLAERKLELLGVKESRLKPIVSADVFVLSHIVTEGTKTYLRIQAVHGPTAGLLGELKLRINPAAPARFTPPLANRVARWWPGVLKRLVRARTKPVWAVLDVYAATQELGDLADKFRPSLREALDTDGRVFLAGSAPLGQTQQEVLMRLLGLSRPTGGRFTPSADYILDARILSAGKIELRVRQGDLAVIEQTILTKSGAKELLAAANDWLIGQVAKHAAKPKPLKPSPDVQDEWARKQARVEYELGKKMGKQCKALYLLATERRDRSDSTLLPEDERELTKLALGYRNHSRRAAQLDPSWEAAAYAAAGIHRRSVYFGYFWGPNSSTRFQSLRRSVAASERFLRAFPQSKHHEEVLTWWSKDALRLARKAAVPPGLDAHSIKITYMRKGLDGHARYMEMYWLTGKATSDKQVYLGFTNYLSSLSRYIAAAKPSKRELQAIVDDWSKRFDKHPDKAPHSDFVRLLILQYKGDKPGYLALLIKLQKRWPDPKHPQWKETGSMICGAVCRLFSVDSNKSPFQLWYYGKRGIGDLPYVGYVPVKDSRNELRGMFTIVCEGWKDAMRAAADEFKKLHPKVRVEYYVLHGKDTLLTAAEAPRCIIAYVAPLTAEMRKSLEEVYRRRLPERLVGYRTKPGSSKREPVMLLVAPYREKHKVVIEFVKFLATPAAAAAMAKHNVHSKGATPETTIAPASGPAATKEN